MPKKCFSLLLVALLVFTLSAGPVLADSQGEREAQTIEKMRTRIVRLGVGEKARATVKLKDGTKLKGYIYQAGENDFVIRDRKTNVPMNVFYRDVAQVDDQRGHSTAKAIAIGAGIGAAAFLTLLAIIFAVNDD